MKVIKWLTVLQLILASISAKASNENSLRGSYWVSVQFAETFAKPNGEPDRLKITNGETWKGYPWAQQIKADTEKLKSAPSGWIPVRTAQIPASYFWLRREDLWDGKPKKVTACWPIKKIEYTAGDWAVEIKFNSDGSGIAREFADEYKGNLSPYKTHAYMSQNIVQFNALNKDKRYFFTAGYKPEDRHLYPNGSKEYTKQTFFSDKELQGCTNQPVVSAK